MSSNSHNMSKQTEQREQRMAGFDRQIIEASPFGMILVDAQTDDMPIIYVNAAFETLTGYSSDEIVGHNCRFFQSGDHDQPDLDVLRDAIVNKQACTVTLRNYRKDGTLFWNELRVSPIFDADGQLTHFVGVQNDVTERKRSEQHLRFLNNAANDLLELTDEDSVYHYVGRKLAGLLEKAIIVINKKQSDTHLINQGIYGLDETLLGRAMKLLGYSPEGHRYPIHPDTQRYFSSEKLIQFDGTLADWGRDVVPSSITRQLEKWARINKLYFIGLQKQDELFADVQIYTRDEAVIEHPDLIEGFIRQASTALERIRIEGELRVSEKRYRSLFDDSLNIVFLHDFEGRFIDANSAALRLLGYERTDISNLDFTSLLKPDDLSRVAVVLEEIRETGIQQEPVTFELRRRDGEMIYIETMSSVIQQDHRPPIIQGIARDITEQKRANDNLQAVLDSSLNGIMAFEAIRDESGKISDFRWIQVNHQAEKMVGCTQTDLLGKRLLVEMPGNREEGLFDLYVKVVETGQSLDCEHYYEHEKVKTWFRTTAVKLGDGFVVTFADITERKQAEDALRDSEQQFRTLAENSPDNIQRLDRDGKHLYVNTPYATDLALPVDQIVGKTNEELGMPSESVTFFTEMRERVYTSKQSVEFDFSYSVNGEMRHFNARMTPEFVPDSTNVVSLLSVSREITERVQMQEALRQSEALYRSMFEDNQAIKLLLDPDTGEIIDANTAAVDFYGYTRDQLLSMRIQAINTLTDAEVHAEMELARSEQRKVFNFRHRLANGEVRDVEVFSGPVEVQGNRYLFSIILDVTTRKQAEDALRQSEEKYRLIAENTSDGIAIIDGSNNRIVYASPTYDRLWGRAVGESINISAEHHYESIHPDDRDGIYQSIDETLVQESATLMLTYRARHKQGHYFWKEDRVRIVRAPSQSSFHAYVISSDVTGRREMEDALLHSEERLRSILENMVDCVWSIDLKNNRLMYINSSVERMTGWPPEAFFANPRLWLEIIHPEDRPTTDSSDGNKNHSNEWTGRIVRRDGEVRWLTIRKWLIKDEQGQPVHAEGIASDITERKLAQQREIELTLEKERWQLLETFIQNMSHEFRTPLATINSGTYLMTRTGDPERRKQKAAQIEDQVKRITYLIDNLILMARVENGDEHGTKPVDIGALVRAVCQKAANACSKQHSLHYDIDFTRMTVHGNVDHLTEAFQQIMHNACRYTPEGGAISVRLWSEARRVWVEIKDSGPGMDEEALAHIFDTLWRQDNAHSTPGLGLGLPITRRVIERHAGKIIVTSEVGQGTTLLVTLPLADAIG